ncbi:MAG: hypothetical protein E7677_02980 [Ruminococcaceae bacterium]|nr:hypothetical protein [Oscillospiraceae bacterium]
MRKKRYLRWLPLGVSALASAVTLVIYTLTAAARMPLIYIQLPLATLILAALPVTSLIIKRDFPPFLNYLVLVLVVLAMDLGNALNFYMRFPFWDVMLHTYFGFVGSTLLYVIFLMAGGKRMNTAVLLVAVFLCTMGGGALWEIFEYVTDALLGKDAQQVWASLDAGKSPVYDTMTDLIVTVLGSAIFFLILLLDKVFGYRLKTRLIGKYIE